MRSELADFARRRAGAAARRVAGPVLLALAVLFFLAIAVALAVVASFFALEPHFGPCEAALILSAGALALAFLALIPLLIPRRRKAPADLNLSVLLALALKGLPALAPRQLALAGVLVALAVTLISGPSKRAKK